MRFIQLALQQAAVNKKAVLTLVGNTHEGACIHAHLALNFCTSGDKGGWCHNLYCPLVPNPNSQPAVHHSLKQLLNLICAASVFMHVILLYVRPSFKLDMCGLHIHTLVAFTHFRFKIA